ncbi:CBS domain-containing protein [Comamonas resistens]|uniref:CBS domain-containing protein n=1 Tax=Comamonas resistens TaxID=3046670 RepID=A0ABY8SMS5_9BURK|nr:CBS domain-containing protein [Comamonas resistens]MDL5039160.1 CBS domain-containing protein [Comamonas resistens]WHS64218.1 CBS domain-containing protein [Comamonas resistens]
MTTVAEILRDKGNSAIYSVSPRSTMLDALKMMAEKGVGALLVLDGAALAGIVTERDYARKIALQGRNSSSTLVGDVMTSKVHCVLPRQTSGECMALMTTHRIRHLPVMDENRQLVGVLSIGDLVKEIISEQQFTIQQLEHYISGTTPIHS